MLISCICLCDVPRTSEELPEPSTSSSTEEHRPAVQVNQFSWCNNAKTDKHFHDKRREFRNSGKYYNPTSFFPSQQAPLVSQEHLQAVVRKVARGDRFKGKKQQSFVIKAQQNNGLELMTSIAHSRQKAEGGNRRDSCSIHHRKLGTDEIALIYQCKTSMQSVKPLKGKKERKKVSLNGPLTPPHTKVMTSLMTVQKLMEGGKIDPLPGSTILRLNIRVRTQKKMIILR